MNPSGREFDCLIGGEKNEDKCEKRSKRFDF